MTETLDIAVPVITIPALLAVGLDLTQADFAKVRQRPGLVAVGLLSPLVALPPLAVGLIALFDPPPAVQGGLLLIAACPIGGISNTYSYLAGASVALSVTLTAISSLLAVLTIPVLDRGMGASPRRVRALCDGVLVDRDAIDDGRDRSLSHGPSRLAAGADVVLLGRERGPDLSTP